MESWTVTSRHWFFESHANFDPLIPMKLIRLHWWEISYRKVWIRMIHRTYLYGTWCTSHCDRRWIIVTSCNGTFDKRRRRRRRWRRGTIFPSDESRSSIFCSFFLLSQINEDDNVLVKAIMFFLIPFINSFIIIIIIYL